jgi:hypothetical protein
MKLLGPEDLRRKKIAEVVRAYNVKSNDWWPDLAKLSKNTEVEEISVFDNLISMHEGTFQGSVDIHLRLNEIPDDDVDWRSVSVPGTFYGHMKDDEPIIESIKVFSS